MNRQRKSSIPGATFLAWLRQVWRRRPQRAEMVEKRQWPRYPSRAYTRFQSADAPEQPKQQARVQNVSQGGIRLLVQQSWTPGSLLHVEQPKSAPTEPPNLLACVVHVVSGSERDCALGCSFIRELTSKELSAFL